ncbi:phthiocerol/phthiodiolone dimycocerosyl transferase family protein [Nocardia brasiliensis]|uniref:phthiocerol/phthiodiolone dimycocerosyl transferase family protein n=1 Tax=Nocardia brasiliensis TaxID=37326 RepID=UPI0024567BF4|nr:hypothetical protein [Nocardia brasiliensis]
MSIEVNEEVLLRDLDASELQFAAAGYCVGYSVRVHGELDLDVLTAAFDKLRVTDPILSCRIVARPLGGAAFAPSDAAPYICVREREYSVTSHTGLADRIAGVEVHYEDTNTAWVTLLIHHAAADAGHALWLLAELWRYYTDANAVAAQRKSYPESVESVLRRYEVHVATSGRPSTPTTPDGAADTVPATIGSIAPVRLTPDQTAALIELGHRVGTTVNGLVSAALLCAVADNDGLELDAVRYSFPVDLRSRLDPAVSRAEATNMLGMALFTPPPGSSDLVRLARRVTDKLAGDLSDGSLIRYYLNPPDRLATRQAGYSYRPGTVQATNWGVIPALSTPDTLTIEDFQPRPQSTDPVGTAVLMPIAARYTLFIYTFQARLTIAGLAPTVAAASELAARLRFQLDRLLGADLRP